MFDNFEKKQIGTKINLSELDYYKHYHNKDMYQKTDSVFLNYVKYSIPVNEVHFNDIYYRSYFSYFSVFDPYNIYYEQQRREDLEFLPLSCNDLMLQNFTDTKPKEVMCEYLIKKMRVNPLKARLLIEEWSCYIKNGEHPNIYITIIVEQLNFISIDQINEMLSYSSSYFTNNLN